MPKKTSVRRTGANAATRKQLTSEEDYERSKKQEMALADMANEVDKKIKAVHNEAQQAVNFLQSLYSHTLNRLTQEEKSMLWVDFEARRKGSATAESDCGSCPGNDGSGDVGALAKKILNDINVVIPGDDVPPGDRRARRKRPAKAQKDGENEASDPKTRRMAAAKDDNVPPAAAVALSAQFRPAVAQATAVSDAIKVVPGVASAVAETPAHHGLQFKYLSATMGHTERRPKPLEKIALTSAATGSPLALEQRVCVLVDGQDVRNLNSGDISMQDIQYLQSVLSSLQAKTLQLK